MIRYRKGNLFENLSVDKKNVVLHVCNDEGRFGGGFAYVVSKLYPKAQKDYFEWYENLYFESKELGYVPFKLGRIQPVIVDKNITIVNMVGQSDCGGTNFNMGKESIHYAPFRPDSFRECMYRVVELCQGKDLNIVSPLMGTGLSGSSKSVVFGIVEEVIQDYIDLTVWEL